jgi:hypothetical protein
VVWFSTRKMPLFVFAVITLAAVVALLVMSMPRLRWWQRDRRRPAAAAVPAGAVVAAAVPAAPAPVQVPVSVVPAADLSVPARLPPGGLGPG